jgi:hypothetical protein
MSWYEKIRKIVTNPNSLSDFDFAVFNNMAVVGPQKLYFMCFVTPIKIYSLIKKNPVYFCKK